MGKSRKGTYEGVAVKAARGEYTLIEPLDLIILKALPDEGTLFAGLYPLGETSANIAKAKLDGNVTSATVASRLKELQKQGLTVPKTALGSSTKGAVWQRTPAAVKLLASKEGKNGSS
jgi:hypothetical protein